MNTNDATIMIAGIFWTAYATKEKLNRFMISLIFGTILSKLIGGIYSKYSVQKTRNNLFPQQG